MGQPIGWSPNVARDSSSEAQAPGWSWRGKTGLGDHDERAVGWLSGLCEREGQAWAYALMIRAAATELERMFPLRTQLARALLIRHGALPEEAAGGRAM